MITRVFVVFLALTTCASSIPDIDDIVENFHAIVGPEKRAAAVVDNCTIDVNDCEDCVNKGRQCFWCEKTQICLNYEWYFPQCPLNDVKHLHCFVNWTSVVIVLAVIAAILVLITVSCVVWCCYRVDRCRRIRRRQQYASEDDRRREHRVNMENRHEQRRMERKTMTDAIRQKYGLDASPTFERMGSGKSKKSKK